MNKKFYISTDISKMNIDFIHHYLSNRSYWAKGRTLDLVKKSMNNSLCFGVFTKSEVQIGFARIATDYVVFAWLMDVFIDENYQGKGIGRMLIESILEHPDLKDVNGIGLRTNNAHGLYGEFGFEEIPSPETWMFKKINRCE